MFIKYLEGAAGPLPGSLVVFVLGRATARPTCGHTANFLLNEFYSAKSSKGLDNHFHITSFLPLEYRQ